MAHTRRRRSSYDVIPAWATRKRLAAVAALLVVAVTGTYSVRVAFALGKLTHTNPLTAVAQLFQHGNSTVDALASSNRPITVAVYGYGGAGHDGPYLTDSIMVLTVQPQAGAAPRVAEISIPRDLFLTIPLGGGRTDKGRINQAYSDGMTGQATVPPGPAAGAAVANPVLEHLLGLHIDHWVGIDFHAFQAAVDAVGGVDVVVPHTFTDDQYPRGECQPGGDCGLMTVHFDAGLEHMDGNRALIFARSRHATDGVEGSDFARSRRQQLVVAALKQKVVSVGGIGKLPDLLNALGDHVLTDLQVSDAKALYELVKDVDPSAVVHISLDDTNFLYECGYPYRCAAAYLYAHDPSFATLRHFLANIFVPPDALGEHARVSIVDGSGGRNGAASRWASILAQVGIGATASSATRVSPTTHVVDNSNGRGSGTAQWLAQFFGVSVEQPPANGPPMPNGVFVILGEDEERSFDGQAGGGAGATIPYTARRSTAVGGGTGQTR